ncbi:GspE/PulE family protein [Pectinatus frisingensis]|uniref:GspE/PulE family protein n=1 Tax=Pectinatus frisingensis TaxID=865 RepID=UPI0018C5A293|nr:GspE/PulE family protein [Pectinatus frisingensis]
MKNTAISSNVSLADLAKKALPTTNYISDSRRLDLNISGAPLVTLVDKIITDAILQKASDIHIEPQNKTLTIRFRIDGILINYAQLDLPLHPLIIARVKIISGMDTVEQRKPQDGSLSYEFSNKMINLRISVLPTILGEKMVLRLLNTSGKLFNIDELELSKYNKYSFENIYNHTSGLIISTGPVNSGKTTTLYAILNKLNTPEKNIVTIEDPIECNLSGITQIQINEKTSLTFENGLRAVLRQDPDIILIGEIRDEITARIAIRAALTGHLVLTTLHTNDAVTAVLRLLDMGIEPYLLSATLIGCISQRLLRRICPNCSTRKTFTANSPQTVFLKKHNYSQTNLLYGSGCEKCHGTGYSGRIAIQEILPIATEMQKAINNTPDSTILKDIAIKNGMRPLIYDALAKAMQNKTTVDEIMRIIDDDSK